jgi:type I restriction-modification system DNA methylase subunit
LNGKTSEDKLAWQPYELENMTREDGKQKIQELVERFRENLDVYKRATYNEAQVRREFIDPFFEALGWDVSNTQGYAEQYKEVIHEDTIKVGRSSRAPDYSFRIGGQRKFFVEAKKPAVNIKEDMSPSYQLRRYAWSAKLPLSVVTDFEEFSVFDCQIKPNPQDKVGAARIAYYTFEEYLDKFDEIYDIFSKEAILKGSFDRYAQSTKGKKGTAEVDSEFLKDIESWRELLAKNLALRNPELSIYELNYAVQKIIDRIIFLRICEDRGIEPYGHLQTKAESGEVYTHLVNHFKLAEAKYNSGIFDFEADKITPTLKIDDKVLKTIIQSLYYPKSPYEFSVLGVEILGNVYEQFLGKVIRLTAGHQAKVETKPEVKKAGGVYYTPQYIVDYIVKNTAGKLIEGKAPDDIAGIKILDPACGSGSFLIGAYTYLLKYHLDWYTRHQPKKHKNAVFQVRENEWYLTTAEKKRILLNNIFGVDIDQQAVEVTKLSLLLKVLEHESRESIDQQVKLGLEGVLPNLEGNIKCGNSLIGPDFYDAQQTTLFDEDEMRRINVFDWNDDVKGFGEIMKRGGFDCVIGNPPYGAEFSHDVRHFLSRKYQVPIPITDSFVLFLIKALNLIRLGGRQAFILPSTWLYMPSYVDLRKLLLKSIIAEQVVLFRSPVFKKVTVETCIEVVVNKEPTDARIQFKEVSDKPSSFEGSVEYLSQDQILAQEESNLCQSKYGSAQALFERLSDENPSLGDVTTIICGLTPYRRGKGEPPQSQHIVKNRVFDADRKKDITYRQYIMGRDFQRYTWQLQNERWISYGDWLAEPRYKAPFDDPIKIVVRQTADSIIANTDTNKYLSLKNVHNLRITDNRVSYPYLLGLLNSKLITWWYQNLIPEKGRVFAEVKVVNLKKLPFRIIKFDDPTEKAQHDKLVALVENMLGLQKKHHEARMERDKELYERQIKIVDAQIDRLVYALYGLTEEEIKVVEVG